MSNIPRIKTFDSTFSILAKDGYNYIQKTCDKYHSDIFQTRFMLKKAVCFKGEEAAKLFYNDELFKRKGVMPGRIKKSLLGKKGVHSLDDEEHRNRKRAFMSLMTPERLEDLKQISQKVWSFQVESWKNIDRVELHYQSQEILLRSICAWAQVPLKEGEVALRTHDMAAMVDAFGGVGPRYRRGKKARKRTEKWIGQIISDIRKGKLNPAHGSAARVMAFHQDLKGKLLKEKVAAVELINALRPTVAVSWMVVFAAMALHQNPRYQRKLKEGGEDDLEMFVQEVRRFYPFAPLMGAKTRKSFQWKGLNFPKGRLVILDIYGTNRDPKSWDQPNVFWPERFANWDQSPFNFIPQGGGDHFKNHRCAGEWITIQQLKLAVKFLTEKIEYSVPDQPLSLSMRRMPAIPKSHFVMDVERGQSLH